MHQWGRHMPQKDLTHSCIRCTFKKAVGTVSSTISLSQPSAVHTQTFFIPQLSLTAWKALHRLTHCSIITIIPTSKMATLGEKTNKQKKQMPRVTTTEFFLRLKKKNKIAHQILTGALLSAHQLPSLPLMDPK